MYAFIPEDIIIIMTYHMITVSFLPHRHTPIHECTHLYSYTHLCSYTYTHMYAFIPEKIIIITYHMVTERFATAKTEIKEEKRKHTLAATML